MEWTHMVAMDWFRTCRFTYKPWQWQWHCSALGSAALDSAGPQLTAISLAW